jgi:predicted glycoside hydrolase/deacetylase ChbG (UPF0249 family)
MQLIFTADDCGRSPAINAAVELAHRQGVLTAASLMVAEPAWGEAVALACTLPDLAVGLHVVVRAVVCSLPSCYTEATSTRPGRPGTARGAVPYPRPDHREER